MENPMSKFMIWEAHPLFFGNTHVSHISYIIYLTLDPVDI